MLLRQITNVSCKIRTFISYRYISSKKMNDFYIRICEPEEKFNVTFDYKSEGLQVGRTFNMKRTVSEPASDFISRIKSNVAKVIDKKAKRKRSKDDSVPTPSEVNVQIYKDGKLIDESQPCKEVFFSGENGITVRINDCDYKVLTNPPWIDTFTIPSNLMVGSYAYPCKLEIIFGSISQSRFVWYKSNETGGNWKEVSTNQNLFLTEDFLGCKIKLLCIPGDGVKTGPQVEALSNAVIKPGPTGLPFLERHKYTEKPLPQGSFRVVSYNLLADVYAETEAAVTELFPYCPPFARNIDYRKQLYIRELMGYNADIICLQECDVRIFKNDLTHVLEDFEGEMTQKNGTVSEGIATFYSKKKFRLLDKKVLQFSNEIDTNPLFSNVWDKVKNCEPLKKNLKERSTVFQALVLENTETDNIVVVGNTHLYFHPLADHIRVIQGGMAVMFLEDIIKNIQNNDWVSNYKKRMRQRIK